MLFSWYVIAYLFLAGAGSGAFLIAAASCMVDAIALTPKTARLAAAVQPVFYAAPALLFAAILFLFFDLGNPEQIWLLLTNPLQSIMSMGAWCVAWLLALSVALVVGRAVIGPARGFQMVCMVGGALFAVGTMTYAGLLLAGLPSVEFWATGWLVVLFVVSALSCGTAVIVFLDAAIHGAPAGTSTGPWRLAGVMVVIEAVTLLIFIASRQLAGGLALNSVQLLTLGSLAPAFWILVVGAGLVLPAWLHLSVKRRLPLRLARMASSFGVLAGGLALRYCIVAAALLSPLGLTVMQIVP